MERTSTDILCELPEETDRANRHILIVSDYFAKWHLLFQIWRQKLLLKLLWKIFTTSGVPEQETMECSH